MAHGIDFGTGIGGGQRKEIPGRNGIGPVGFRVNSQYLPFQAVGVGRSSLIIPAASSRALIGVGCLVVTRVIANGDKQVAL